MDTDDGGNIILEVEDTEPFAKVPAQVLLDTELSLGARLLYGMLLWLGWRQAWLGEPGYAGQEALARQVGTSQRSVRNYMHQLEERGYIQVQAVGLGRPANIRVLPLSEPADSDDDEQLAAQ